jgi:hypothetical protein
MVVGERGSCKCWWAEWGQAGCWLLTQPVLHVRNRCIAVICVISSGMSLKGMSAVERCKQCQLTVKRPHSVLRQTQPRSPITTLRVVTEDVAASLELQSPFTAAFSVLQCRTSLPVYHHA